MTSARYATNDRFGIEITGDLLDLIKGRSSATTGDQSVGDVTSGDLAFCAGHCPGLGGWVAVVRMAGTGWWTITTAEEISPANLVRLASGEEFPDAPAETRVEFKPSDMVRLLAPAMIVRDVMGDEVTCLRADAPDVLAGTYPAATLVRIAPDNIALPYLGT